MRIATSSLAGAALLLCSAAAFAAAPNSNKAIDVDAIMSEKAAGANYGINNPIYVNVGGDTVPGTPIGGLPYADSGNTCGFVNNYDAVCPFTGSTSPDVVYSFSPGADVSVNIDICNSLYDTKVYVFANTVGNVIACNDDACGSDGFKSLLECVPLVAGNTYYIVVDGYFGDCGTYDLVVSECTPCVVDCAPGSTLEGEPVCGDDYRDTYNAGCNTNPPAFSAFPCGGEGAASTVCGTYGGYLYFGLSYRDTDWYSISLDAPTAITFCVTGELDTLLGIIDGNAGCPVSAFYDYAVTSECVQACLSQNLPAGDWWFFVGTSGFGPGAGACGSTYNATLTGYDCGVVSVESASWGSIKNLYR